MKRTLSLVLTASSLLACSSSETIVPMVTQEFGERDNAIANVTVFVKDMVENKMATGKVTFNIHSFPYEQQYNNCLIKMNDLPRDCPSALRIENIDDVYRIELNHSYLSSIALMDNVVMPHVKVVDFSNRYKLLPGEDGSQYVTIHDEGSASGNQNYKRVQIAVRINNRYSPNLY